MAAYHDYIRQAVKRGYTFDFENLQFITPSGTRIPPRLYGKQKYPSITINVGRGKNGSFALHKFVAYILYGEDSFAEGINVRHLDGDVLNLRRENIVLGSSRDNELDKPKEVRISSAKKARAAQGKRPHNCYISEENAECILREYLSLKGSRGIAKRGTVKGLAEKYGFNRMAVQCICTGHSFKDIYRKVLDEQQ